MIYVNGDSSSEASTYLDNPGDCWPFRIQQSTNPVFVDAVGGGSNYRIARTSTETLLRIYPRVNHAIFAWTDPSRWEKPGGETLEGEQYFLRKNNLVLEETVLIENFLTQIKTMDNLCDALGINSWHMHSFSSPGINLIDNELDRQRLQHKASLLDSGRWILPFDTNIAAWATANSVERDITNHLSAAGNAELAVLVKNAIQL